MKLREEFFLHENGGELLLICADRHYYSGYIRCNETAARIIEHLENDVTETEIVDRLFEEFDAPREVIATDVRKVLEKFREIGALDEKIQ